MSLPLWTGEYVTKVRQAALALGSDGCSWAFEIYPDACREHDVHYRLHRTLQGMTLDRAQADYIFRERVQQLSFFGGASPMSWWRYAILRVLGGFAWRHDDDELKSNWIAVRHATMGGG